MAIKFLPSEFLDQVAPDKTVKKLVSSKLTLNRAALTMLSRSKVLSKKTLTTVAVKVIRQYKEAYSAEREEGASKSEALDAALNEKKLMVSRVQNAVVNEVSTQIKEKYRGEYYEWIPSTASTPDPLHALNYGKTFQLGVGEQPGDRYGCMCGMNIMVDEDELEL